MRIALIGNPNSGKSTLFNQLTGLNQKVGNFPGVTVDKKIGFCQLSNHTTIEILDLPGTYSLYPKSIDESIVLKNLINPQTQEPVDLAVVVTDASNLKRNLLLFTQVKDLAIPTILVLNQIDVAERRGTVIDVAKISQAFDTEVVTLNARTGKNLDKLKNLIDKKLQQPHSQQYPIVNTGFFAPQLIQTIRQEFQLKNDYWAFQYAHQAQSFEFLSQEQKQKIQDLIQIHQFDTVKLQSKETLARYEIIDDILQTAVRKNSEGDTPNSTWSEKIDKILLHRVLGYVVFLSVLLIIFASIFQWAEYPMGAIESVFGWLKDGTKSVLPAGVFTELLADGILAGLEGIVVFIPQIALLFAFISILEESGYMARVVFIMDRLMRVFGLNGKSVVPLISGAACAVPAIMATRNIDNWKERLITIFVTPLMSCSARLPVYVILIGLVVPNRLVWGIFPLQGVALMAMYLLGFGMALLSALIMKWILRTPEKSYLIMELPAYKTPRWQNVGNVVWEKIKVFVLEAGRVILAISIILWVMASYGPAEAMKNAEKIAQADTTLKTKEQIENRIKQLKLENSFAGQFGKFIEPVIAPLGYDWKIGIALITSFAAREVFVGTISTIYNVGSEDDQPIREKMRAEINPYTRRPVYTPAVGFSLLVFYAFAMQCMSTMAVVYRETKGWKYPIIQFIYLTGLAYLCSWLVFNLLS
ncbi:MAG: ferrous iron transport protein B [Microscillaceae bacterium]|jgi:ferrous iron transport protein B|nr:ferrous iron transport protein B [Microscillaceae bacterium]